MGRIGSPTKRFERACYGIPMNTNKLAPEDAICNRESTHWRRMCAPSSHARPRPRTCMEVRGAAPSSPLMGTSAMRVGLQLSQPDVQSARAASRAHVPVAVIHHKT